MSFTPPTTGPAPWDVPRDHPALVSPSCRELYRALSRRDAEQALGSGLADLYVGARYSLLATQNPERYAQAAHSLRELITELAPAFGVEVVNYEDLLPRTRDLVKVWESVDQETDPAEQEKATRKFHEACERYVKAYRIVNQTRIQEAAKLVAQMDPQRRPLPAPLAENRGKTLSIYRRYFTRIAKHHRNIDVAEFDGYLDDFERFLLDYLCPRVYEDPQELRSLLESPDHAE